MNDGVSIKESRLGALRFEAIFCALSIAFALLIYAEPTLLMILITVGMLTLAYVSFKNFVLAMVALLPLYPILDFELPLRDLFLVLRFLLFVGVWLQVAREDGTVRDWLFGTRLKKLILGFAAIAALSLFSSGVELNLDAIRAVVRLFSYLALFFGMERSFRTETQLTSAVRILLLSTIVVDCFGFIQAISDGYTGFYYVMYPSAAQLASLPPWDGRITSFLHHCNSLAAFLNLVLPFAFACGLIAKDREVKMLGWICFSLTIPALILTQSRGGLLGSAGVLATVIWFAVPRVKTRIQIALATVCVFLLTIPLILEKLNRLRGLDDETTITRIMLWASAFVMFRGHPILGVGYGNFRFLLDTIFPQEFPGVLDAHSLYFQLLAEIGLVGFFAFFAMMVSFLWQTRKMLRTSSPGLRIVGIGMVGAVISLLIHGVVDYVFIVSPQFGGAFWVVLGLGYSAQRCYLRPNAVA